METVNDSTPPTEPPPPYRTPGSRLTRSGDDKVVAGLAGGLGRYFGIDPVVFRIAFVVLTLAGGSGVLLYLVGWLMIPDDAGHAALQRFGSERSAKLVAAVLAGVGLLVLLDDLTGGDDDIPVGLVLVGLGVALLWSRRAGGGDDEHGPPPPSPPPPPPTPTVADVPLDDAPTPVPPSHPTGPGASGPRSTVVPVTLSLLALVAGVVVLLGLSATTGLAVALVVTGGALIAGAWLGGARWLIPVGLVLAAALAATAIVDVPVRGGAGDVLFRPVVLEELRSPYRLGAGELFLDLGDLDLRGETVTVVASVAAGSLQVVVPGDAAVEVEAHVGVGTVELFGGHEEGLDVARTVVESGREGAGRLVLRARAGIGEVAVRRALP